MERVVGGGHASSGDPVPRLAAASPIYTAATSPGTPAYVSATTTVPPERVRAPTPTAADHHPSGRRSRRAARMSWQTYVDEHLMCDIEGHHLTSAAIIGHDGTVWAQSTAFPSFKPEEMANIMKDFDEPGFLAPTGLFLGPTKYMVIQGEPGAVIRGKKGSGGVTVKKTGQALVIGIYDEPMTPGQCNMVVERLGDYLVEQGL